MRYNMVGLPLKYRCHEHDTKFKYYDITVDLLGVFSVIGHLRELTPHLYGLPAWPVWLPDRAEASACPRARHSLEIGDLERPAPPSPIITRLKRNCYKTRLRLTKPPLISTTTLLPLNLRSLEGSRIRICSSLDMFAVREGRRLVPESSRQSRARAIDPKPPLSHSLQGCQVRLKETSQWSNKTTLN